MKTSQSKLLVIGGAFLAVTWTGSMMAQEKPASEIELMKLEFLLACEQSPSCIEKRESGRTSNGKDQMIFRKYKPGKKNSEYVLEVKRGAKKAD